MSEKIAYGNIQIEFKEFLNETRNMQPIKRIHWLESLQYFLNLAIKLIENELREAKNDTIR